jgi:hypothetical protein
VCVCNSPKYTNLCVLNCVPETKNSNWNCAANCVFEVFHIMGVVGIMSHGFSCC